MIFKIFLTTILFSFFSFMQVNAQSSKQYEKEWKKVDSLLKKNLPKSALAEVKKIYTAAKNNKQEAQIIKSLIYLTNLQQQTREENEIASIKEITAEIPLHKEPATSILKSYLADLYLQYFNRNRWKFYNRTTTVNFNKDDIATWSIEDFHKKISELYLQSINNKNVLQQTKLEPYDAIIIKGNVRHLRPTLYDLLANKALEYFKNDERNIKKPAYAFEIDQPQAFAPAMEFAKVTFTTKDSLSLHFKALQVYQDLIKFHLPDAKPDALIDIDIDRIQFVYNYSVLNDKEDRYREALENIIAKYKGNVEVKQAQYLLAAYYESLAAQYDPLKDTTHRYARLKAKDILESIVKDSSVKTAAWSNSYNLLKEITRKSFLIETEKINVPGKPFRSLVQYKNIQSLHLRLIKTDEELKKAIETRRDENIYWNTLLSAKFIRSWQQPLPQTEDLQQHAVEIKVDALPVGEYFILASADDKFNKNTSLLGAQLIYVSNISYINQTNQIFVLHRETGQPLTNAAVEVYTQQYDYKNYKYTRVKLASYKTDKNGYFKIASNKNERQRNNYFLDITYGNDHLNLNDQIYDYYNYDVIEKDASKKKIFFFTDRSIYRPGQTVYFKGITILKDGAGNKIVTDYKTKIFLEDANGEEQDSIEVTTNEYGSFSGKFQLPKNLLNGEFAIYEESNDNNNISFSVEEYKRPKFYVAFDTIKGSYKVGDSITIIGNANAYAGNDINGAKVSYRVVRQPRFIYPWLSWRWLPRAEPMEITHGEVVTNDEGSFKITFKAIPDLKIDKKTDPVFDYRIYVDVTDINGETRSNEQVVSASYKSLILKVNIAERLPVDSLKSIAIRTENMSGEFEPAKINLKIFSLKEEERLIRNRYWQQPDQFIMSKEEYISYFPHDEYKNENDFKTWDRLEKVYETSDTTKANAVFNINNATLKPGFYVIEIITQDKEGAEVKDIRHIELYDANKDDLTRPEYLWVKGSNKPIEPGEKTSIQIGSSAKNVFLIEQVDKFREDEVNTDYDFKKLDDERKKFEFGATEKDRGGYGVSYFFVKDNRFYQFNDVIEVPWTNKDLNIEYATFRNKTLPGSEEKWTVKINGYKGDKVAAEMLASMYDASLDQFKMHQWNEPGIWPVYARTLNWVGYQNFSAVQTQQKWINEKVHSYINKIYDRFVFSPYGIYNQGTVRLRGMAGNADRVMAVEMDSAAPTAVAGKAAGIEVKQEGLNEVVVTGYGTQKNEAEKPAQPEIQPRKNFNETAFFFPHLKTDKDGSIEFSFTMPEALTQWKFQTLTHTKELAFGSSQKEIVTQKQLMVQPNAPRFLREGDRLEFTTKIANLTDKEFTGQAQLMLFDATTNESVDGWFQNIFPNQYFTVAAGKSEVVKFPIQVPYNFNKALVWRIVARADNFSDGEEDILPVLTNKALVTETITLPMKGTGTRSFSFDKLKNFDSETAQHHALTVEYTSNPAWYVVQALPYLMEYPYECAEQNWNRYYANSLATKIVNSSPRIKQIFEKWRVTDTAALLSNLQKNEELKSVLLEETPWVLQAKTEEQQKKNIALLFDLVRMSNELQVNMQKLKEMQSENGGFIWFKGGPDDRYITQYIVTGIGHLKKLGGYLKGQEDEINSILRKAIPYLDRKIKEDYERLIKDKADLNKDHIGAIQVQYLYMRSFFPEYAIPQATKKAYDHYRKQAEQFWTKKDKYMQGMIALALNRTGNKKIAGDILKSLKETAIVHEELGMYWKEIGYGRSWYWYHAPIETQALLIEAFTEISNDKKTVDELKTWLLKNKQTNNWRTTKATAEACYAFLLQGTDWLSNEPVVTVTLGDRTITNKNVNAEAGTGYFKERIEDPFIKPEMGNISVTVQQDSPQQSSATWGAVYWQYFEELDKITTAATPLQLNKKLFIEKNTDRGPVLTPVADGNTLNVGDKIKVRIELRVDRDMEYVHMKDMRASALEPTNVLSGYKWQGGLGYYETTKDVSTNFFFNYLRKGTYVFEYTLFVTHAGDFSNGITTIQCMYAPEYTAHSEGVRITVE